MQRGAVRYRSCHIFWFTVLLVAMGLWMIRCGESAGQGVYRSGGCPSCHGRQLEGSNLAPSLKGLAGPWTRDELRGFLKNPSSYVKEDPRMREMAKRYLAPMPAVTMSDDQMDLLLDYLMGASTD